MKIHYLKCLDNHKLFSFFRHHYNHYIDSDKNEYFIDGGVDYYRYGGKGKIEETEIKNVIENIREQFIWGQCYDKEGAKLEFVKHCKLKDLETDHIYGIISHFIEPLTVDLGITNPMTEELKQTLLILTEELKYRNKK